jgi:hypothetical protein
MLILATKNEVEGFRIAVFLPMEEINEPPLPTVQVQAFGVGIFKDHGTLAGASEI